MNHSLSLSELIEKLPFRLAGERSSEALVDLHATLTAHCEAGAGELVVELDAYVCPDDANHMMEDHLRPEWLPGKQVVRVGGEAGETSDIARDVFHSWVRRVRESVPGVEITRI
jgi:hypothetical protein